MILPRQQRSFFHASAVPRAPLPFLFLPAIAGLFKALHVNVWTFYYAADSYGWPRIYRRLLEANRTANADDPASQRLVRDSLKLVLRTPTQAYSVLADNEILQKVGAVASELGAPYAKNTPDFLKDLGTTIAKRTKTGKIVQDLEKERSRLHVRRQASRPPPPPPSDT